MKEKEGYYSKKDLFCTEKPDPEFILKDLTREIVKTQLEKRTAIRKGETIQVLILNSSSNKLQLKVNFKKNMQSLKNVDKSIITKGELED